MLLVEIDKGGWGELDHLNLRTQKPRHIGRTFSRRDNNTDSIEEVYDDLVKSS